MTIDEMIQTVKAKGLKWQVVNGAIRSADMNMCLFDLDVSGLKNKEPV